MPTGLALPVGVDKTGRAKLVDGNDEANQLILTALSDNDNEHAFQQDVGMGSGMVFDINDETVRAQIITRLLRIFRDFLAAERFRLKRETITWSENPAEQELILEFKYIDLQSDEEQPFRRVFTTLS